MYLPLGSESPSAHPLTSKVFDPNGQTLLHLAILQQQDDWVHFLGSDPQLKQRCNKFGLTPFEFAQFLNRESHLTLLGNAGPEAQMRNLVGESENLIKSFSYIPCSIFETASIFEEVLHSSFRAKEGDLIPSERLWMGVYFDKELKTALNPRLSLRYIDEEIGYGVFAEQKIPACAFVGEYTGIVREYDKKEMKDKIYCVRYNCWQTGARKFVIDAETHGNHTRFINHSCQPNLALQAIYWRGIPRMILITLQEIQEGTQLTFDYGRSFWKEVNRQPRLIP